MKDVTLNSSYTSSSAVTEDMLAELVGSGEARVLSTPMLIALMENAAMKCAAQFLDSGETTVGTYIAAEHTSATPLGMGFEATATLVGANGRELAFEITAADGSGSIGKAVHRRFIVQKESFQRKAESKNSKGREA